MDMSGKFTSAGEAAASGELARALAEADAAEAGRFAVAWRDGEPIVVDLSQPMAPPRRRRVLPEHVAIVLVFVVAWVLGLGQLHF